MKKLLLSASLLCFVLSSTLTSCSSDDDKATTEVETPAEPTTPTEPTEPETPETPVTPVEPTVPAEPTNPETPTDPVTNTKYFTYNGVQHQLDNSYFLLQSSNGQNPDVINIGSQDEPELVSYWISISHSGTDVVTSPRYYQYTFAIPVAISDTGYTLVTPAEANPNDIIPMGIYAELNLVEIDLDNVDYGQINFTNFNFTAGTMSNTTNFGVSNTTLISHNYTGDFSIHLTNILGDDQGRKTNNSSKKYAKKGLKVKMNNLKIK